MIVLLFTVNAFSQKLYINAALGYGLGTHKSFFQMSSGNSYIYYDTVYENNKVELQRISFGQGANFEIGVGTLIGEHIAIEINGLAITIRPIVAGIAIKIPLRIPFEIASESGRLRKELAEQREFFSTKNIISLMCACAIGYAVRSLLSGDDARDRD